MYLECSFSSPLFPVQRSLLISIGSLRENGVRASGNLPARGKSCCWWKLRGLGSHRNRICQHQGLRYPVLPQPGFLGMMVGTHQRKERQCSGSMTLLVRHGCLSARIIYTAQSSQEISSLLLPTPAVHTCYVHCSNISTFHFSTNGINSLNGA